MALGRLWSPGPWEGANGPAELVPRWFELWWLSFWRPEQSPYGSPSGAKLLQTTVGSGLVLGSPEGVTQPLRHHPLPTAPVAILSSQGLDLWLLILPIPQPLSTQTPGPPHPPLSLKRDWLKLVQCGLDHEKHGKLRRSFPHFHYILRFVWCTTGSRWAICFLRFFCIPVNPMSYPVAVTLCFSLSTLMTPRLAETTPLLLYLPLAPITDYFTVIVCLYYVALTSSQGSSIIPHRHCAHQGILPRLSTEAHEVWTVKTNHIPAPGLRSSLPQLTT